MEPVMDEGIRTDKRVRKLAPSRCPARPQCPSLSRFLSPRVGALPLIEKCVFRGDLSKVAKIAKFLPHPGNCVSSHAAVLSLGTRYWVLGTGYWVLGTAY